MKRIAILFAVAAALVSVASASASAQCTGRCGSCNVNATFTTKQIKTMVTDWKKLPLSEATDFKQLEKQIAANPAEWEAAYKFLTKDLASMPLGRQELTCTGTFANIQEYTTKLEGKYEGHRKYIDVQVAISGAEDIFVAPVSKVGAETAPFNTEKDIVFWVSAEGGKAVPATPKSWVVLFPNEAHMPGMAVDGKPAPIRKVVVKIPYSE